MSTPQTRRAAFLIAQASRDAKASGFTTVSPVYAAHLENAVRTLCAALAELHGDDATPANGCDIAEMSIGDASVHVEFEYEAAGGDGWEEPRYPASVNVCRVLINGLWCYAADVVSADVIERWERELLDAEPGRRADAEGEARISAYEAAREVP